MIFMLCQKFGLGGAQGVRVIVDIWCSAPKDKDKTPQFGMDCEVMVVNPTSLPMAAYRDL